MTPTPDALRAALAKALERQNVPIAPGTRFPFSPGDALRAAYRDLAGVLLRDPEVRAALATPAAEPGLDHERRRITDALFAWAEKHNADPPLVVVLGIVDLDGAQAAEAGERIKYALAAPPLVYQGAEGMSDLHDLSDAATPGPWTHDGVDFEPPSFAGAFGTIFRDDAATWADRTWLFDSREGTPADAAFIVALVNAYREGRLVEAAPAAEPGHLPEHDHHGTPLEPHVIGSRRHPLALAAATGSEPGVDRPCIHCGSTEHIRAFGQSLIEAASEEQE